ncbi:hypothetical protein AAHE18_12G058500 [Arachis hypogaea]
MEEEEEAAAEILQLHELHHSDLILLSSSNPTSTNASSSSSFDEDLLRKTSSVMEALGPMGPGLLAVTGVPNASELRSELLRLAPKLALLHRDTRKRVLKVTINYQNPWSAAIEEERPPLWRRSVEIGGREEKNRCC